MVSLEGRNRAFNSEANIRFQRARSQFPGKGALDLFVHNSLMNVTLRPIIKAVNNYLSRDNMAIKSPFNIDRKGLSGLQDGF
jgi:hypothetical protein